MHAIVIGNPSSVYTVLLLNSCTFDNAGKILSPRVRKSKAEAS